MKKKILNFALIGIMLFGSLFLLTGCGEKKENNEKVSTEENETTSTAEANSSHNNVSIDNSAIENTIKGYYTALYSRDAKTAYQYVDFEGIVADRIRYERKSYGNEAEEFLKIYNEIISDTEKQNKIKEFIDEKCNDEFFNTINSEVTVHTDVEYTIKEQEKVSDNLYKVSYGVTWPLQGTQRTGINETTYMINKDGKYYIVTPEILWKYQFVDELAKELK